MLTFNFLCIYFGTSFIFFYQFKNFLVNPISIYKFNIISLFTICFYLLQFLGLYFLFFSLDKFRSYLITDKNLIFQLLLINSSILIYFLLINDLFKNKFIFQKKKLKKNINSNFQNFIFFILILLLILFCGFLFNYGKDLPTIKYLFTDSDNITKLRQDYVYTPFKKYSDILFGTIFKIIFLISLLILDIKKKRNLIVVILSFIALIFYLTSSFQKFYIFELFTQISLIFLLSNSINKKKINLKYALLSILIFVFLIYAFMFLTNEDNFNKGLLKFMSRTFTGNLGSAYHYLEIFPNNFAFLGNEILPNPFGVFNFETVNLSKLVKSFVFDNDIGSMPSLFWADFYAGYYYSGILIAVFIITLIFILIEISFNLIEKNKLTLILYTVLVIECLKMNISFLSNYFFKLDLIISLFLILSLIELNKLFNSKKNFSYN